VLQLFELDPVAYRKRAMLPDPKVIPRPSLKPLEGKPSHEYTESEYALSYSEADNRFFLLSHLLESDKDTFTKFGTSLHYDFLSTSADLTVEVTATSCNETETKHCVGFEVTVTNAGVETSEGGRLTAYIGVWNTPIRSLCLVVLLRLLLTWPVEVVQRSNSIHVYQLLF
jgi:hypothetical protein